MHTISSDVLHICTPLFNYRIIRAKEFHYIYTSLVLTFVPSSSEFTRFIWTKISLSRTLVPSSPVLVEGRDKLLNILLRAFNLFQTDIRGDNFTSNRRWSQRYFQDESRPVIFDAIYKSGFLPAFRSWISIGTSVWVNGEDRLPLCNVALSLFGLNLQMPSERC